MDSKKRKLPDDSDDIIELNSNNKNDVIEVTDYQAEVKKPIVNSPNNPVCKYGSDCYRKNPIHLNEFFHPFDKDKGKLKKNYFLFLLKQMIYYA